MINKINMTTINRNKRHSAPFTSICNIQTALKGNDEVQEKKKRLAAGFGMDEKRL